jgi:predicted DNA-binding transcriptional regulator YafY
MAGSSKNKIVALRILEVLTRYSDESHELNAAQIIGYLEDVYDLKVERKAVYRDIAALEECGYDIIKNGRGYFLGARPFESAEIRLLIDAVQSARFISGKKTQQMIQKLGTLCSEYDFKALKQQVFLDSRTKCANEEVFYSIDAINRAISGAKKLTFKYLKYDEKRKAVPRYGGKIYEVNPYSLVWADDAYYLICNMDKYDTLAHYRVDRMASAQIKDKKRRPVTDIPGFKEGLDAAKYIKGRFTMFSGEEKKVQIRFHNSLRDVVYDRFGTDVTAHDEGEYMVATVSVLPSPGFYSWLFMLGDKAKLLYPESVVSEYRKMLIEINEKYNYN